MCVSLLGEEGWEDTKDKRIGYESTPEPEANDEDDGVEHICVKYRIPG